MRTKRIILTVIAAIVAIIMIVIISYATSLFFYRAEYVKNKNVFDVSKTEYDDDITVMSYNIRCFAFEDIYKKSWFYRADFVRQVIASYAPDVIGFQEVTSMHEDYMKDHLVGYDFAFAYRKEKGAFNEAVAIAYRTDRFEKIDEGKFWLSETPDVPSKDYGSKENRLAIYTVLKERSTGKTFAFYCTHLDYLDDDVRAKQMDVLLNKMGEIAGSKIFLGDLNGYDDTDMYDNAAQAGYVDAYEAAIEKVGDKEPTFQKFGGENENDRRIDYIFTTPDFTVKKFVKDSTTFNGTYPSDHFPLIGILTQA